MNPPVWNSANPASRKRPLDTSREAGMSQYGTIRPSTSITNSAPPLNHGMSLRERFAQSKWADSKQLDDISQQSVRHNNGATSRASESRVEYRSTESVFARAPPTTMFGTELPDLNHAPPDHWFSKLRADWLQPKQGGVKKKKKKKIVSATTTESQSPPPQSPSIPPPAHGISSLQPPSTVDTPSALSPTATQYSQDDTQDLIAYETDDGTTLPPSSPPDLDAMSKMVAAFETYTVEDSVTQQLQDTMTEGLLQDQERGPTIPIIITDIDAREPNAAQTSASSTSLTTFLSNGQLDDAAPATHSAVVKPIVSVPELESTPRPFLETHQTFGSAPNVPGPFTHANLLGLLLDQSVAQTRHFSAPHPVNAGYMNLLPSDNSLYNSVSNATSESALLLASTNSSALPSASATETPDKAKTRKTNPSQRKKTKPTVLKEGQRNLKNKGIHQCPVAGCTETSTRYYDLINRHVIRAHPEEALILGIHKPAKARTQPEGAGKLDLNRNMMSVDVEEEIKPSQDFNCPSCFHPYSRRDALIRHAESQINPERKNKPSCNLTVEQVHSLRKKFKVK